jgi:hypothetical protein
MASSTSGGTEGACRQRSRRGKRLTLASVRATSARRRHVPGPAFPVARSGVRIWRAEPIDARHGRAALLERGVAAVDRPVQAGAVIRAPTAVSTSTRGGRGQGQNNEGDQNEWDRAHDCLLDRSIPDFNLHVSRFRVFGRACTHSQILLAHLERAYGRPLTEAEACEREDPLPLTY